MASHKFSHIPFKEIGNGLLSSGAFLSAYILGGYTLGAAVAIGGACYIGYRLLFGTDLSKEDLWQDLGGLAAERALKRITKARKLMAAINEINHTIPDEHLSVKLDRLEDTGHKIIELFEKDPGNLKRSKRFIEVYLDGAVSVSRKYAELHLKAHNEEMHENYKEFLKEMVKAFDKQYHALLHDDMIDLDVEIEVLKRRMKSEAYYK